MEDIKNEVQEDVVTEELTAEIEVEAEGISEEAEVEVDEEKSNVAEFVGTVKGLIKEGSEEVSKSVDEKLEAVKSEIPSVDGFIKEEAVDEKIKSAVEEFKKSLPAVIETKEVNKNMIKFEDIDLNGQIVKGQKFNVLTKAISDNTDVAGGRVDTNMPYHKLEQMNVIGRMLGTTLMASGGVVKLPDVSGIDWASEATHPGNTLRTAGGTLSSKNVTIETWVSENSASLASLQDVPGLDSSMVALMTAQLGKAEAEDAVAIIKAENFADDREITTGVSTGLPTAANVVGVMADLAEAVEASYKAGASYIISRGLWSRLQQSNNNGLNFNPMTGISTLFGYNVYIIDQLEDAATNGNLNAVFGDFSRGIAMCSAENMMIGRYDQTRPGAMTYFGQARFKHAVWDVNALATLKTGA